MKIQNKKNTKKIIILSSAFALVLAAGAGAYTFREQLGLTESDETNYTAPSREEISGEDTAEQANPDDTSQSSDDPTIPNGTDNPSSNSPYRLTITSINQIDNTLQIRTMISPLVSDGNCKISLGKAGESTIEQTANIQSMAQYSTCQGFNIDTTNLAKGSWSVEVTYSNNDLSTTGRGTAVVE